MEEKERYELQEVFEDDSFHWCLKDNDTKLLKPLVNLHNCVDLLNQQDRLINCYKKELKNLLSKFFDYMKALAEFEFDTDITLNDFSLLRKYFILFRFVFKEEFVDFYRRICDKCDLNSNFSNKKDW